MKLILTWFELLSWLRINYGKCEFIGVRLVDSQVVSLPCRVRKLPSKYLGLPLCLGIPKSSLWDSVLERVDKRLSSWKGKFLSLGGQITLIKCIMRSLPIYLFPNALKV